jgi:hypothetical protein
MPPAKCVKDGAGKGCPVVAIIIKRRGRKSTVLKGEGKK